MLGRTVDSMLASRGQLYPWGDMLPDLMCADALLINLECALTDHREEWTDRFGRRKMFYFRADPTLGRGCLDAADVTFGSFANNHAGDYGTHGLLDTVTALDEAGILHAGAGASIHEAATPARFEVKDFSVAVVAFSDHPADWAAGEHNAGIHVLPEIGTWESIEMMGTVIGDARPGADVLICSLHWGPNMRAAPTKTFRAFAHAAIDAGADVLFGHSAHVVQGVEIYRGKVILYDTGDFVDDYAVDDRLRNDLSALFLLKFVDGWIDSVELVPVEIDRCQVNHASGPARDWFADRFASLCELFGTRVIDTGDRLRVEL
jgi:poly-gamma-glutamate synthesis protein (capsule biosynthesis protein)